MAHRLACAALVAATALAAPARADTPGCTFAVNPTISTAAGQPDDLLGQPTIDIHWATNCTGNCASNWQNTAAVEYVYTSSPVSPPERACGVDLDTGDQQTSGVFPSDSCCLGCQITPVLTVECFDPLQSTLAHTKTGAAYVVPPAVSTLDRLQVQPDLLGHADWYTDPAFSAYRGDPSAIPVGYHFHLAEFFASPRGAETVTLHATGAGVSFSKTYGAGTLPDGGAQDPNGQWLADTSPDSFILPTQPGPLTFWVEFQGTQSNQVQLTVVSPSSGGSSGSTGSSGSGGSTGGGSSSRPKVGCSAAGLGPAGLPLALAALALARARRRAYSRPAKN